MFPQVNEVLFLLDFKDAPTRESFAIIEQSRCRSEADFSGFKLLARPLLILYIV